MAFLERLGCPQVEARAAEVEQYPWHGRDSRQVGDHSHPLNSPSSSNKEQQGSQQQIQQSDKPTWESHKAVHPDLDDKNHWVDISVLENVERLGTLRKAASGEHDGQAEAAYPSCGRNHTCGEVLTAKPR